MGCISSHTIEHKPSLSLTKSDFVLRKQGSIQNFYEILDTLGGGGYGVVTQVKERKSNLLRAMKEIPKSNLSPEQHAQILNEINILIRLDHPNIMKIYEVVESQKSYHIICEYLSGGELLDHLIKEKLFSEVKIARYIYDILSGVLYCHNLSIVHNDLKLENLMLDNKGPNSMIKIIDFGISRYISKTGLTGQLGSVIFKQIYYMAPEILTGAYDEKVDMWSIGVILYFMVMRVLPFKGNNKNDIFKQAETGNYDTESYTWYKLSFECKDLISKLLCPNPKRRLSAAEALRHPWLTKALQISEDSINISFCTGLKKIKVLII